MNRVLAFLLLFCIAGAALVLAHSGRTDAYGGHHNRKTGGYHYHNAGRLHDANNPYQDHTKCGICATSQKAPPSSTKSEAVLPDFLKNQPSSSDSKNMTYALQAGLKCMGYGIAKIDGVMGNETKAAINQYITEHKDELENTAKFK